MHSKRRSVIWNMRICEPYIGMRDRLPPCAMRELRRDRDGRFQELADPRRPALTLSSPPIRSLQ
jgi:hypothetical protein